MAGRFLLAYALLATFWASSPMTPGAFSLLGPEGTGAWLDAPSLFGWLARVTGISALRGVPGALWIAYERSSPAPAHASSAAHASWEWRGYAVVSLLGAIGIPLLLTRLVGPKTLHAIGLRLPRREALPLVAVAYLCSLPLIVAMATHPGSGFREGLRDALGQPPWFAVGSLLGGLAEHVLFHGILLAWLHRDGAFPPSSALLSPLVWPGRGALRDCLASLAIPRSCLLPCVLSGVLFWTIHVGKPDPELWSSLPGGIGLAWLAYRTNGPLAPFLLHLATAGTAVAVVLFLG